MNCESIPLLLNAALDGELSPEERAAMQQHLAECAPCQDQWIELQGLHHDLTTTLSLSSVEPAVQRILRNLQVAPAGPPQRRVTQSSHGSQRGSVAVVCLLLVSVVTILHWPVPAPAVAEIAMATGPIDFKPANARDWIAIPEASHMTLSANSRVRTRSTSLCEIRTRSDAIVRLNSESELVMRRPEKMELVSGELWCRAPAAASVQICSSSTSDHPSINTFVCPSSTEMQWRALPNQEMSCVGVAPTPAEIQLPQTTCTIQPGETLTFAAGQLRSESTRRSNPLQATSWQLPLLVLRNPQDLELRERLTRMLEIVGQTKASYLYEDQIRKLGPAGALPLIAYVRSPESRQQTRLRIRAMSLATEMATVSSLPDFEVLLSDDNPIIRKLAHQALLRLQPDRRFPSP